MERPFDYPGSTSNEAYAQFHQMTKITSWLASDDGGEATTNWSIWSVPDWWTDEDMQDIVDDRWAAEHCHHSYDCCGQMYGRRGQWAWHPHYVECGSKAVVISQRFVRNI